MINKIKTFITRDKKSSSRDIFDDRIYFGRSGSNEFRTDRDQLSSYEKVAWVSVAVDALSTAGGGQDIYYTDPKGTEIDTKRIDESIYLPFINGFGNRSFSEWMKTYIAHRLLTGNALCLRSKKSMYGLTHDVIEQFIPVYPGKYKPLVSSSGYQLIGYQINLNDGRQFNANVDDVMHFTQNTNFKPFEGVGNISKLRLIAETEFNADEFQSDFLKKGAAPSLIIEDPTHRTDEVPL